MRSDTFLDEEALASFPVDDFLARAPFPWWNLAGALKPEAFAALHREYPPLSLFEWHEDRDRVYGQRPHNRYYLAYASPDYWYPGRPKSDFPQVWQDFLTELETSEAYREFTRRALGETDVGIRYTFHVAIAGCEVSPHVDKPRKIGTHIFYFNTSDDWDPAWGGSTVVLDGRKTEVGAPDFADFEQASVTVNTDNMSFFFKNTENAWHGVPAMTCPEGYYRRLFNVVLERPDAAPPKKESVLTRGRRRVRAAIGG